MGLCHSTENKAEATNLDHPKHPSLEEKVDSWFDEVLNGVKHVGENFLELVGRKVKHDVTAAEKLVYKAAKDLKLEHLSETCIPGVYSHNGLHDDVENLFNSEIFNELGIVKTSFSMQSFFKSLEGKKHSPENYEKLWKFTSEKLGWDQSDFPFDHFPKKLDAKQLKTLISTNPFVTMGLSTHEVDGKDWVVFDATKHSSNPLTALICGCLPDDYATSKVWISADFKELYLEEGKEKYTPENPKFDVKLRIFITTLMYYFEIIHAVLHVYAYIMLGAAGQATHGTPCDSFMNQYEQKILTKYFEVSKLLITKPGGKGAVVGGYWPADYRKAMNATKEIFQHLAKPKNAQEWMDQLFLAGNPDLKHNMNLLPQCRPYVGLTEGLAHQTLKNISLENRTQIDAGLVNYFSKTAGKNKNGYFNISSFKEWVECQTMMGILHGNTLTISRLIFTNYNRFDGDWEAEVFSGKDASTWVTVAGTLLGLEEDHAINEVKPVEDTLFEHMMTHFEESTRKMQADFWTTLEPDDKQLLGWIYSVWGPNMLGNTQLTVTTYV